MPLLLLVLAVGVVGFLWYRRATTTLTRDCRWRQDRARGQWRCAYCGARRESAKEPVDCLRGRDASP